MSPAMFIAHSQFKNKIAHRSKNTSSQASSFISTYLPPSTTLLVPSPRFPRAQLVQYPDIPTLLLVSAPPCVLDTRSRSVPGKKPRKNRSISHRGAPPRTQDAFLRSRYSVSRTKCRHVPVIIQSVCGARVSKRRQREDPARDLRQISRVSGRVHVPLSPRIIMPRGNNGNARPRACVRRRQHVGRKVQMAEKLDPIMWPHCPCHRILRIPVRELALRYLFPRRFEARGF